MSAKSGGGGHGKDCLEHSGVTDSLGALRNSEDLGTILIFLPNSKNTTRLLKTSAGPLQHHKSLETMRSYPSPNLRRLLKIYRMFEAILQMFSINLIAKQQV